MKHNCKIKDNSLSFELKTVELTKINKLGRTIVKIKQCLRKLVNAPDRTRIITLSGHLSMSARKNLDKVILTEIHHFRGKQVIKVRTDINSRMLKPL